MTLMTLSPQSQVERKQEKTHLLRKRLCDLQKVKDFQSASLDKLYKGLFEEDMMDSPWHYRS